MIRILCYKTNIVEVTTYNVTYIIGFQCHFHYSCNTIFCSLCILYKLKNISFVETYSFCRPSAIYYTDYNILYATFVILIPSITGGIAVGMRELERKVYIVHTINKV